MEVDGELPPDPYPARWNRLKNLTKRQPVQGFNGANWDGENDHSELRVLVIGAGGLGCEILKDLALSGFRNIDVIDLDTIDLSNLNRQFLFRHDDIGKSKADTAAKFVMKRVPGVQITPHFGPIEEKDDEFYLQFNVVILGLDSLKARSWINDKICSLMVWEDPGEGRFAKVDESTIIPMVDGGTEGFKGHVRMLYPTKTSSFKSSLGMFPPPVAFPMCTIENTPRLPEHCVMFITQKTWSDENPFGKGVKLDGDSPEHIQWVTDRAMERANQHNIKGIDYRFTQGVVKNVIPAIASTNAIVAAGCVNEVLKLATGCNAMLDNYTMYNGGSVDNGIYAHTFPLFPEPDDQEAGPPMIIDCDKSWTVKDFIEKGLLTQFETQNGQRIKDASRVQLENRNNVKIRSTGALANASKDEQPIASFVDPEMVNQFIYVITPEIDQDFYRVLLRFKN
eukprot:NODE_1812_length_1596_cov_102.105227_g1726_i0.p1 GENE.NODE_1812_length_1596_cov_102.105227_g1726_i0~~NODE_1812_length_1596_cov_102.105227_g1726_i0.p1  ORF type:complete len:472 (+),score=113.62 NODE_1812_length_1596_cov_102.105227_g1726_i0:65-1417(+)